MKAILIVLSLISFSSFAQDDLLKELDTPSDKTENTIATFKGTRIINGHSIETKPGRSLEFIFSHRFGPVTSGWYELFGLDQAFVRLGLDYGITDKLSVSIGRNSVNKTVDPYIKYKVISQRSGIQSFPVTMTVLGGLAYEIQSKDNTFSEKKPIDRLAYTTQVMIARKFSPSFSFQLMPTLVHKNAVDQTFEKNNQFALGAGTRLKITRSLAITGEYYHNFSIMENSPYYDALGFGLDIETGGHVFQLVFTNSVGLTERAFITETTDNFFDGDIRFGFNVTRTFQFRKK